VPIESMDPKGAHEAMQSDDACSFLDVRTCEEFDQGHPANAVNVPWAVVDRSSGQMTPNPEFAPTVKKHFPEGTRLYLSCQAGMRSLKACMELEAAGYTDLVNVDGGYGGRRDPMGQVVAIGWTECELPVDESKSTYQDLCGS
jgi:rhodanese-related sulfurtransferase